MSICPWNAFISLSTFSSQEHFPVPDADPVCSPGADTDPSHYGVLRPAQGTASGSQTILFFCLGTADGVGRGHGEEISRWHGEEGKAWGGGMEKMAWGGGQHGMVS